MPGQENSSWKVSLSLFTAANPLLCSTARFHCKNGLCIDKSFVCDSQNNCQDNSDEESCESPQGRHEVLFSSAILHQLNTEQTQQKICFYWLALWWLALQTVRVKCVESVHMHALHPQCSEEWYLFQVSTFAGSTCNLWSSAHSSCWESI